jgi:hypothetical protein
MKKVTIISLISLFAFSCGELTNVLNDTVGSMETGISEEEASNGLKEALEFGVNNGTSFLGKTDGFLKNAAYKILVPEEVRNVEQKIRSNVLANAVLGDYLDKLVTAMNRGAEKAMTEAKPIFVNAIKAMTIRDAINIVTGGEGAATNYLKRTTSAQLQEKFYPVIQKSLDAVGANEPWTKVSSAYNMVMGTNVTTDLNQYVTDNAMTALFTEIKKEEDKIREDPLARITPILKKVFGYADSKKQ